MCGFCCSFSTFWTNKVYKTAQNDFNEASLLVKFILSKHCPAYNTITKRCKVHNQSRSKICEQFPLSPDQMVICSDDCGYSFIETPDYPPLW